MFWCITSFRAIDLWDYTLTTCKTTNQPKYSILKNIFFWILCSKILHLHVSARFLDRVNSNDVVQLYSIKIAVLKIAGKFFRKTPVVGSYFNKIPEWRPATLPKIVLHHGCLLEIFRNFQNSFSIEYVLTVAVVISEIYGSLDESPDFFNFHTVFC